MNRPLLLGLLLPGILSAQPAVGEARLRTEGAGRGRREALGRHVEHSLEVLLPVARTWLGTRDPSVRLDLVLELPDGEASLPLEGKEAQGEHAVYRASLRLESLMPAPEGRRVAVFPARDAGLAEALLEPMAHDWLPMAVAPTDDTQSALDKGGAETIRFHVAGPDQARLAEGSFLVASEASWVVVAEPVDGTEPADLVAGWSWGASIGDGPVWKDQVEVAVLRLDRALRLEPEAEGAWVPGCMGKDEEYVHANDGLIPSDGFEWKAPGLLDMAAGAWYERYPTTLLGYAGAAPDRETFARALGALAARLRREPEPRDRDHASEVLATAWLAVHDQDVPFPGAAALQRNGTHLQALPAGAAGWRHRVRPASRWQPPFWERLADDEWLRMVMPDALQRHWALGGGRPAPVLDVIRTEIPQRGPLDLQGQDEAQAAARLTPFFERLAVRFFNHPEACDLRGAAWWWIANRYQQTGTAQVPTVRDLRGHFTPPWARTGLDAYSDAEVEEQLFQGSVHFAAAWPMVLLGERVFSMDEDARFEAMATRFSESLEMTAARRQALRHELLSR